MGKVIAAITTSVDGYIVGPQDGPEHGLGWAAGSSVATCTTPPAPGAAPTRSPER